jgi:dehydrogenase/reductase SDR family member 7B
MAKRFDGQVVWITGASSGIGNAVAAQLVEEGAYVIVSARRKPQLDEIAARAPAGRVLALPLDVSDEAACEAAVGEALAWRGRVDMLVLNAGITQRGEALKTPMATVREVMEVNYFGAVALARAVVPHMVEQGSGRVVVVTSVTGYVSTPMRSGYAASKHALHGWFDALRAELHGSGVSVTLVVPGYVNTDIAVHARLADGGTLGHQDQDHTTGISPERCAAELIAGAHERRDEVLVGGPEIYAVYLKRFLPWVVARIVHRFQPK